MVLPLKYQAQLLLLFYDGQGHQMIKGAIAICQVILLEYHVPRCYQLGKNCPQCHTWKEDYTDPKIKLDLIIPNNPMHLVWFNFTKLNLLKDGKENILVFTYTFTKFSQAFITPNQDSVTFTKILVMKWFYVYGIPAHIHSNKGQSFHNEIMKHLNAIYWIDQWTTMPYNPHGNAPTERLNNTLIDLLKSLTKEQNSHWPLHWHSLVFAFNAMPHSTTNYQLYEPMFGCKVPTIYDAWHGPTNYNDNFSQCLCAGINQQHKLILATNTHTLKRIKHSEEISVSGAGGNTLNIPLGNLVLVLDHPEGGKKIQDNYKSELLVMEELKHKDTNVYHQTI